MRPLLPLVIVLALALDIKASASGEYWDSLLQALAIGVQDVKQSLDWDTAAASFTAGEDYVAFAAFVDSIWVRTEQLRGQDKLGAIMVGNEIDGYLQDDAVRWEQYGRFLAAARRHILSRNWGDGAQMLDPVEVPGDLAVLAAFFPDHAIRRQECGMSSGVGVGSSTTA